MKSSITTASLIIALMFCQNQSNAQAFVNGSNVISVGLGLGSALGNFSYASQTPAISLQFEHGQWEVGGPGVISLGGYLGYKGYTFDGLGNGYSYSQKWNYTVIGVRSAYHYNGISNKDFDVYGGLMLAYDIVSYKYTSNNHYYDYLYNQSYGSGVGLSLYVGGRYFFTEKVGVFAELGYGISYFTIGASFKL